MRSHQRWEISPTGFSGHHGSVELQGGLAQGWEVAQACCYKAGLVCSALVRGEKGGREAHAHPTFLQSLHNLWPLRIVVPSLQWSGHRERLYSR